MIHDRKRHAWRLWSEGFHAESLDGVAWKQTRLDVKGHVFEDPSRQTRAKAGAIRPLLMARHSLIS